MLNTLFSLSLTNPGEFCKLLLAELPKHRVASPIIPGRPLWPMTKRNEIQEGCRLVIKLQSHGKSSLITFLSRCDLHYTFSCFALKPNNIFCAHLLSIPDSHY